MSVRHIAYVAFGWLLISGCTREFAPQEAEQTPRPWDIPDRSTDGEPTSPPDLGPAPYSVSVSPPRLTLTPGGFAELQVVVARNGFEDPIDVAAIELPAGVSSSELRLAAGATSGALTLSATTDSLASGTDARVFAQSVTVAASARVGVRVWIPGPRGVIDESFGEGGLLLVPWVLEVQELPNGQLLLATSNGLCRVHSDGTLDTAFAVGGCTGDRIEYRQSVFQQIVATDDGILVSGRRISGSVDPGAAWNLFVARYLPGGEVDASFGTNGWVEYDITSIDHGDELAVTSAGRILVLCAFCHGNQTDSYVLGLSADGSRDPEFATDGLLRSDANKDGNIQGLVTTADGFRLSSSSGVRGYLPNGMPDLAYGGGDGVSQTSFWSIFASVGGGLLSPMGYPFGARVLSPDGTLIREYDPLYSFSERDDHMLVTNEVTEDFDAHLVFGGVFQDHTGDSWPVETPAIGRRLLDGTLDAEFGVGGITELPFHGDVAGVTILRDGRILVFGASDAGGYVVRLSN